QGAIQRVTLTVRALARLNQEPGRQSIGKGPTDLGRRVLAAVVHHNDLDPEPVDVGVRQAVERFAQGRGSVAGTDDDGNIQSHFCLAEFSLGTGEDPNYVNRGP